MSSYAAASVQAYLLGAMSFKDRVLQRDQQRGKQYCWLDRNGLLAQSLEMLSGREPLRIQTGIILSAVTCSTLQNGRIGHHSFDKGLCSICFAAFLTACAPSRLLTTHCQSMERADLYG